MVENIKRTMIVFAINFLPIIAFCQNDDIEVWLIDVGTGINTPYASTVMHTYKANLKAGYDQTLFPPAITASANRKILPHGMLSLRASYRGLQNAYFIFHEATDFAYFASEVHRYTDSFLIKSDAIHLGIEFKKYSGENYAKGFYYAPGIAYAGVFSKIYPTLTYEYTDKIQQDNKYEYTNTNKLPAWGQYDHFLNLSFAMGGTSPVGDRFYIDYGVRGNLYIGKYKDQFDVAYDPTYSEQVKAQYKYESVMDPIVRRMALGNLARQHYIDFYVKIGYEI